MIVPQFWAEARVRVRTKQRQITIRRFGWSDLSQEDAQAMADARAKEAFDRVEAGEALPRREPKQAYNGAQGVPIREEIVARHGETIITRNSYGARCLNTPNVLFADIDFPERSLAELGFSIFIAAAGATALAVIGRSLLKGLEFAVLALGMVFILILIGRYLQWLIAGVKGLERAAMSKVERFVSSHPEWHLRTYRTPAGLRLLAVHRTFDPLDDEVAAFFAAIGADYMYVLMCRNQRCFRARVSPKPWRIGIEHHLKPRPGTWPIRPERIPDRIAWVANYEREAEGFSSCRYLTSIGGIQTNPLAEEVQRLHDDLCRATSDLPIA